MNRYLIFLVVLGLLIFGVLALRPELSRAPEPVACTMEAKLCPDGSAVGRVGPKCEFAICPNASTTDQTSSAQ